MRKDALLRSYSKSEDCSQTVANGDEAAKPLAENGTRGFELMPRASQRKEPRTR